MDFPTPVVERLDTDPPTWAGYFRTPRHRNEDRWCGHRHRTEQAALACANARQRAIAREERWRDGP